MIPTDLRDYLFTLIAPPGVGWEHIVCDPNVHGINWPSHPDKSLDGVIVGGTPTEDESREILRALKPGAHLLLIAPDEEPTGHTGAIRLEEVGFEIRDAILLANDASKLHYVPKPSRAEREAGCRNLQGKAGHEAVKRKEGTAGVNSPRAGAGRTATRVKNFHPTVKPVGIMAALLRDVPQTAGPVLDPFMGSGTTGIACLRTGHDFLGIERDEKYLEIADARIRHWNHVPDPQRIQSSAHIESDHKAQTPQKSQSSLELEFLFGLAEESPPEGEAECSKN